MKRILLLTALLISSPAWGCDHVVRAYNTNGTINFCLWEPDGTAFDNTITWEAADCKIMQDEGAEANCTNTPQDEGSCWSLVVAAAELDTARTTVILIDDDADFLDKCITIDTFGNASAQFPTAEVNVVQISGDATAADNAELMFDGTGYAGGTTKLDVNTATVTTGAITAAAIAADAIGASELAADSITSSELAADSIGASELAADSIGASEIAASAITSSELATDAIGAAEIATDAATEIAGAVGSSSDPQILYTGTAQTVTGSTAGGKTFKLAAATPSTADLVNMTLVTTGGAGAGQSRRIVSHDGSTDTVTVDKKWKTTTDNTTTYAIVGAPNTVSAVIAPNVQ